MFSTNAQWNDFDVPGAGESSLALHTLSALPFDAASPIIHHYPAMKLGVQASVRFCAEQLGAAARAVLARESGTASWVIASPPRFVLPGAANLIAREIHRDILARGEHAPGLAELLLAPPDAASRPAERTQLYSQARFDDRVRERKQIHERLVALDPDRFRGRAVLFINDINVTGAQQHFMRKAVQAAGAANIHWLYLVTVPPEVGRANPEIEYELNYSRFASFDEFAAIVSGDGIDFTARCINRLFDYDDTQLLSLLRAMTPARKALLLRLAEEEARCQGRGEEYWNRLARMSV